uniref:Uncharacterized protein n=1 Tax=Timema shepardi TaxID=629360 RepID=A0A7R9B6M0_TIMSH|nr:unnamed protein product [Timema shepardi]
MYLHSSGVILPQLAAMSAYTLQSSNQTRRLDLAVALIEAFSSAVYCSLSKQTISTVLLPGLSYQDPGRNFGGKTVHTQIRSQNLLACSKTNSHLLSKVLNGPSSILTNDLLKFVISHDGCCAAAGPPCVFVVLNRCPTCLEPGMPLKHWCTAHAFFIEPLYLEPITSQFLLAHHDTIMAMIKGAESRVEPHQPIESLVQLGDMEHGEEDLGETEGL